MTLWKVVLRLMKLKYTSIVLGSKHDFLGVNRRWEYFLCNIKEWIFCFLCLTFPKLNSFFIVNSLFSWSQRTAACFAWPQIFFDDIHFYWLLHVHSFQRDLHKYFAICHNLSFYARNSEKTLLNWGHLGLVFNINIKVLLNIISRYKFTKIEKNQFPFESRLEDFLFLALFSIAHNSNLIEIK